MLYERHTPLITTAATEPENLYTGMRFRHEFKRTISRLEEMRSTGRLTGAHLATRPLSRHREPELKRFGNGAENALCYYSIVRSEKNTDAFA